MTRGMATYIEMAHDWTRGMNFSERTDEIMDAFWGKGMRGTGNVDLATISKAAAEPGVKDTQVVVSMTGMTTYINFVPA